MSDQAAADQLAARWFPQEWAKWSALTGERARRQRTKLRRAAEHQERLKPLREAGRSCKTCRDFEKYRHGPGFICNMQSDFHGYQMVKPEALCPHWSQR